MERFVYAAGREGCGLASLKMLLVHFQRNPAYARLHESEGKRDLEELRLLAEREGVRLIWKKATDKASIRMNRRFPLLLLLESGSSTHLVYLKGRRGKRLIIYDPKEGKRSLTYEDIEPLWTGIYAEGELLSRKRPIARPRAKLPRGYLAALIIQSMASSASLLSAFYFFQNGASPYIPIAFFALFGIFFALGKIIASKGMSFFDARYLDSLAGKDAKDPSPADKYTHYQTYKRLLFQRIGFLSEGFSAIIPIAFLLAYNSLPFLLSAGLLLFSLLLFHVLLKRPWRLKADILTRREAQYLAGPPLGTEREKTTNRSLSKEASSLANGWAFITALEIAAVLLFSFLPSLFENRIELNFYLLSLFGLLALRDGFGAIEKVALENDAFLRERAYFEANFGDA